MAQCELDRRFKSYRPDHLIYLISASYIIGVRPVNSKDFSDNMVTGKSSVSSLILSLGTIIHQ